MQTDSRTLLTSLILAAYPWDGQAFDVPDIDASDWPSLLDLSIHQKLSAVLYLALGRLADRIQIPPEVMESLRRLYLRTTASNLCLSAEMSRLLKLFERESIPAVVLKGAALAPTLYPAEGCRPMVDLDLLVPRESIPGVQKLMEDRGFTLVAQRMTGRFRVELEFYRKAMETLRVEPHWHLFQHPREWARAPIEWFWSGTVEVDAGGQPMRILRAEAQVLHLAVHMESKHTEDRTLLMSYDMALVISHYRDNMNWDELLRAAEDFRMVLPLRHALGRAADDWSVALPSVALAWIQTSKPGRAEQFAADTCGEKPSLVSIWLDLRSLPDVGQKVQYAICCLFPNREYLRSRYPGVHPVVLACLLPWRVMKAGIGLVAGRRTPPRPSPHAERE